MQEIHEEEVFANITHLEYYMDVIFTLCYMEKLGNK